MYNKCIYCHRPFNIPDITEINPDWNCLFVVMVDGSLTYIHRVSKGEHWSIKNRRNCYAIGPYHGEAKAWLMAKVIRESYLKIENLVYAMAWAIKDLGCDKWNLTIRVRDNLSGIDFSYYRFENGVSVSDYAFSLVINPETLEWSLQYLSGKYEDLDRYIIDSWDTIQSLCLLNMLEMRYHHF